MNWVCPNCKRIFSKINQAHSCTVYPLNNHFKNKEYAKELFDELLRKLKSLKFRVDPVPCCIHLVKSSAFAAVWAMKDRIRIDFTLNHELKSNRISKHVKMSANKQLYLLDIKKYEEIDKELIDWIKESAKGQFKK